MHSGNPKVSVLVPFHWMKDWQFFLNRCLQSIYIQSFQDYEVILTKAGSMPVNSNRAIQSARGEIIKILYMDDFFSGPQSLQNIADNFQGGWMVTECVHAKNDGNWFNLHRPSWNRKILEGVNSIGSPSVLTFENKDPLLFDENLSWLLDADLYHRLHERYGEPTILEDANVVIGIHDGQATHLMSEKEKRAEFEYLQKKYG